MQKKVASHAYDYLAFAPIALFLPAAPASQGIISPLKEHVINAQFPFLIAHFALNN